MTKIINIKKAKIRKMNDRLRKALMNSALGRIVVTPGVMGLDSLTKAKVFQEIMRFDGFNSENDPFGEHDHGCVEVSGKNGITRVLFQIDYYDKALDFGSDDPSDERLTTRVLTIMLPQEW